MSTMMINFHVTGIEQPIMVPIGKKADIFAKELDRAGKKWRLGKTC